MAVSRQQDPDPAADLTEGLAAEPSTGWAELRVREGRTYLVLRNEFATVWLAVEQEPTGVRVVITDAEAGTRVALDPLELEAISRMGHADFDDLILERGRRPENPDSRPTPAAAPHREADPSGARNQRPTPDDAP